MDMPDARPICRRTPDRLTRGMVIRFDGFTKPEMVLRNHELDTGSRLIRTSVNLHCVQPDVLVEVIAIPIPGIGFALPIGDAA